MSYYMPYYPHYDRMPVDISFVFDDEKPAGKHGFCTAKGDSFVFEDGSPARFFGVICNGASNFPTHEYAEKAADRLMQAGVNYVRFHQLDAEWATPNLYRVTAGKTVKTTRVLCPESMDRIDYWIKCLKERGIYSCIDMITYRKFKTGDGVAYADLLHDNSKTYAHVDPVMIELQKETATQLWNHFNPYTGLAYKDDPFFFACIISNENETFKNPYNAKAFNKIPYYEDMIKDKFSKWLEENKITDYDMSSYVPYNAKDDVQYRFRTYLEIQYATTMYDHIRSLGVKVPICDTNWAAANGLIVAQKNMDFVDGHAYLYDWRWGEWDKFTENKHLLKNPNAMGLGQIANGRLNGVPCFMTEWNSPWSNSYRAEGPLWFTSVACLQGWSGMSVHTYAYNTYHKDTDIIGVEAPSNTIGSVPYRQGIFTVWNDPSIFGLFYHCALMMRRGDVSVANKTLGIKVDAQHLGSMGGMTAKTAIENHKVVSLLPDTSKDGVDIFAENQTDIYENQKDEKGVIRSDTNQLWRDPVTGIGYIDTPMTKAIYGSLGANVRASSKAVVPELTVSGLSVTSGTDFGVIAMSSLSKDPIETSDNILLTAVGRSCNTNMQFDGEKLLDYGTTPIKYEVIQAKIALKTDKRTMRVWAINDDGFYTGRVPAEWKDGVLTFTLGPTAPGIHYLLMEE